MLGDIIRRMTGEEAEPEAACPCPVRAALDEAGVRPAPVQIHTPESVVTFSYVGAEPVDWEDMEGLDLIDAFVAAVAAHYSLDYEWTRAATFDLLNDVGPDGGYTFERFLKFPFGWSVFATRIAIDAERAGFAIDVPADYVPAIH